MPLLAFSTPGLEDRFLQWRLDSTWLYLDRWTTYLWTVLFLSIIKKNHANLPAVALLRSFSHFLVIVSPLYLQVALGKERYKRYRTLIITVALAAYVFHPGGGLYRDAQMQGSTSTLLGAATLSVKLLVGSRTLFWMILSFGYPLPLRTLIPVHLGLGSLLMWLKPSEPFCRSLLSPETAPLFRSVVEHIPLLTLAPSHPSALPVDADACNSLVTWIQIGLGFLLPTMLQACSDYTARTHYIRRHKAQLGAADRERWLAKAQGSFSPYAICLVVFVHLQTALWYLLTATGAGHSAAAQQQRVAGVFPAAMASLQ